jgi:flagellar M-ring protein FliF
METLLKQLRELPARFTAMPAGLRLALIAGVGVAVALAIGVAGISRGGEYQYVFTNLTQEDSTEAGGHLTKAGIPFRTEANGTALAVPADKVYDSRILLATAGLPRGGGIGFEIFDRGDLGVSDFTQRVNLRRAIEGELARTIGSFSGVRSARVTVSLGERGLYRDEDKKAAASVVVVLQPGRTLGERELAGVRHLVSSSTPGLSADAVTVMDGRGAVLSADSAWDSPEASYQRKMEREFEQRIITLLEPVVGAGSVLAKVTASVDSSLVNQNSEVFDPDQVALRSERTTSGNSSNQTNTPAGVAGAQANIPLAPVPQVQAPTQQGNSNSSDLTKNFEITKTTTQTVAKLPRLTKISVAVIVDGVEGKARSQEEVARLGELARKAVGFDDARGDQFEITSQAFGRSAEVAEVKVAATTPGWVYGAVAGGVLLLAAIAFFVARRAAAKARAQSEQLVLMPGATVSSLEAKQNVLDGVVTEVKKPQQPLLVDPLAELRERARMLVQEDPERAVMLVRAWLSADLEKETEHV